jgi:hypothetical protein
VFFVALWSVLFIVTLEQNSGDESINDPLPAQAPSAAAEVVAIPLVSQPQQPSTVSHSSANPAESESVAGGGLFSVCHPVSEPSSSSQDQSVPAFAYAPASPAYMPMSPAYSPSSPVYAPSLPTASAVNLASTDDATSSDSRGGHVAPQQREPEPLRSSRPMPWHYVSGGSSTAANRTDFVILFGSTLPGTADPVNRVTKLRWSVQAVDVFMDTSSLSRAAVVSELLSVDHEEARRCKPDGLSGIICSYGCEAPSFAISHCLERHQILQWYASVAAIVGTRQVVPRIVCPAKRECQLVTFNGAMSTCSICSHIIYVGSSVARSVVSDFCVCEACCCDPKNRDRLRGVDTSDSASSAVRHSSSSNAVSDLLELVVCPRSFIPAADNFADDKWHKAMDMWMRSLCDVLPSNQTGVSRPRHLVSLEERVSNFRRRVPEPQFYFRVSDLDQANVSEAMKQIFDSRTKINVKLHDAQQGSIENSKLTVLFRHKEQAGQAAGMPANIHSDGITPVLYSTLALEFSNPRKIAAGMWLPSCFNKIDGEVEHCGLFPRPFIPDPSPSELQLQKETVERFLLLGRCIGIALRDRRVFMLPMSLALADALCGKQLSIWDTCLGEIDLQEQDDESANCNVLHVIEHCHDSAATFSMVFRGQTLSSQRVNVPIYRTSFSSPDDYIMHDKAANIVVDSTGSIFVNVTADVLRLVQDLCGNLDPAYAIFAGQLPAGLSSSHAYKVSPVSDFSEPRLRVCVDGSAFSPRLVESQDCPVRMSVMRVHSSSDGSGDGYLRAIEVPNFDVAWLVHITLLIRHIVCAAAFRCRLMRRAEASKSLFRCTDCRCLALFFMTQSPLVHIKQELCGDGLLEALGVTTQGERGISNEAWAHFVNNV